MRTRRRTIASIALLVLLVACVVSSIPAFSATTSGSITMVSPSSGDAVRLDTPIEWSWKRGDYVRTTSRVDVYFSRNLLQWTTLAKSVPIMNGSYLWNTKNHVDGYYFVRVVVSGTTIRSTSGMFLVDNTNPVVEITRPATGQVIVEDETPSFAVVAGSTTLVADPRDSFSGIESVTWLLEDEQIGTGVSYTHNFNDDPGQHELTAVATDRAGNTASASIDLVALPGPSAVIDEPPTVEDPTVPEDVPPDTGDVIGDDTLPSEDSLPTADDLPGQDDIPGEDDVPSDDVPVDPSQSPSPDPSSVIPEGIPPGL
jgi:hypothetical protein